MNVHLPFAQRHEVVEHDNDLVMRSLLGVEDSDADLSITWVAIDGRHRRLRTTASTRVYVVLDGDATFSIEGHDEVRAVTGDLVVIPQGCAYDLAGTMRYLVINQPGYRLGDDDYVDDPP